MRTQLLSLLTCLTLSAGAQKMIPAAEWCAAGKRLFAQQPPGSSGADTRSDSIDLLRTHLLLNVTDFAGQSISGSAEIQFAARVNGVSELRLDLLSLTVDSVVSPGGLAGWAYNGQQVSIQLPSALAAGQQASVRVYYRGKPVTDASNWGGFYWQNGYAYNLGVGFAADPHNFGRAWFPCFDNFVERCAFKFDITTPAGKPAFCNGRLIGETVLPGGQLLRQWQIDDEIPSYLACVAVGPFATFKRQYTGEAGVVPVEIAVASADSTNLKNSFIHLPDALAAFEHWYGPYRWDKIGYSVVPFNSGAMEHATNVAYMRAAVDGSTGSETLMAHEFSHHWWGDLATCSTAEDMWLNEGWAVYSEHLFLEAVYGPQRYRTAVESNFLNVLEDTHVNEGGYRAVSGLPHQYTYGEHVYNKGAVVAHNLRGYLGDSLFRSGLRATLAANEFDDWSSAGFRDKLGGATGYDLTDFFNDWVFSPGFTHFSVDSFHTDVSVVDSVVRVAVFLKQKLRGAPHFYQNVPLELTFLNAYGERRYETWTVSGETNTRLFLFPLSFVPLRVWVNTRQRLTLARAEKEHLVKSAISYNFSPARMTLKVNSVEDSVLLRVEHHYATPDNDSKSNPYGFQLSNHYWSIDDGAQGGFFEGDASFFYDGRGQLDQLDTELFAATGPAEDSVFLAYRPAAGWPWKPYPNVQKNTLGSPQDRYGLLRAQKVSGGGQFTIAKGNASVGTGEVPEPLRARIAPNPAKNRLRVQAEDLFQHVLVVSAKGEVVREVTLPETKETELQLGVLPAGAYWVVVSGRNKTATLAFQKTE